MPAKKILIVENDNIIAMDLVIICKKLGYECKVIKKTEKAYREVKILNPDFIIMDLETEPQKDIFEEAERICDRFNVPIIFFTRADPNKYKNNRLQKRCNFIPLPFDFEDIKNALKNFSIT